MKQSRTEELLVALNNFQKTKYFTHLEMRRECGINWLEREQKEALEQAEKNYAMQRQILSDEKNRILSESNATIADAWKKFKRRTYPHATYDETVAEQNLKKEKAEESFSQDLRALEKELAQKLDEIQQAYEDKKVERNAAFDSAIALHQQACAWEIRNGKLHFSTTNILPLSCETEEDLHKRFGKDAKIYESCGLEKVLFPTCEPTPESVTQNKDTLFEWILNKLRRNSLVASVIAEEWAE